MGPVTSPGVGFVNIASTSPPRGGGGGFVNVGNVAGAGSGSGITGALAGRVAALQQPLQTADLQPVQTADLSPNRMHTTDSINTIIPQDTDYTAASSVLRPLTAAGVVSNPQQLRTLTVPEGESSQGDTLAQGSIL